MPPKFESRAEAGVLLLTNSWCESVNDEEAQVLFLSHGLESSEQDGRFYPLTNAESRFTAAEDAFKLQDGTWVRPSYTALYNGQKFLMPSALFGLDDFTDAQEVSKAASEFASLVEPAVVAAGGKILIDQHKGGAHVVRMLVPFSYATENAENYPQWVDHLKGTLLAAAANPIPEP